MTDRRDPLLKVDGLSLSYQTRLGEIQAVRNVSFELARGSALGLVGESGCGKTSVANCLMRLLPDNARLSAGRVLLDGQDVLPLTEEEMRLLRWRRISMVFQAAMNVLDPCTAWAGRSSKPSRRTASSPLTPQPGSGWPACSGWWGWTRS